MPTYTFLNKETHEVSEVFLKISELDAYKASHPELEIQLQALPLGDPIRLGLRHVPDGFREVMRQIADNTPGGKGLRDRIR